MRAIFARTYLDSSILKTGFIDWAPARYSNWTTQAEFKDYGPGFNETARKGANFTVQLTKKEYEPFDSPAKVFQTPEGTFGNTGWIDFNV